MGGTTAAAPRVNLRTRPGNRRAQAAEVAPPGACRQLAHGLCNRVRLGPVIGGTLLSQGCGNPKGGNELRETFEGALACGDDDEVVANQRRDLAGTIWRSSPSKHLTVCPENRFDPSIGIAAPVQFDLGQLDAPRCVIILLRRKGGHHARVRRNTARTTHSRANPQGLEVETSRTPIHDATRRRRPHRNGYETRHLHIGSVAHGLHVHGAHPPVVDHKRCPGQ